ncbi:MAG: transketolase, partial [Candidatus Portnoybacteria bacterium]|nr:transketolase [Candidatus Portnoybacteria bacterium]
MIIAKTIKGKGVSFLEDKGGWHGRALSKDELVTALQEFGDIDISTRGIISKPSKAQITNHKFPSFAKASEGKQIPNTKYKILNTRYSIGDMVATRKAYGNALVKIFPKFPNIVVLDAEVSNSTFSEIFQKAYPERFFEMYIAEQNMVGAALGFSRRGKIPFISTFAAFFTRAFDQIRMSQYSDANIKFVGSHAGVSIGEDGPSQMGLEDIAMFRLILNSIVLYPSDAVSTEKLLEEAARYQGIVYLRTRIAIRVIDLYSVKPIDADTLKKAARETKAIITVEDHFAQGGLGEAVTASLSDSGTKVYSLAVRSIPKSGKPQELLDYEEISKDAIVKKVKEVL